MSLTELSTTVVLDVYDHDTTPLKFKAIALDSKTRYVNAHITDKDEPYDIGQDTTVTLTVIRPDKTGVQVTGTTQAYSVYMGDSEVALYGARAELTQTALAISGTLLAQFMFTGGEQILRTEIFTINNGVALDATVGEWAAHYYEFGDYFRDAFPYNMNRSLLDDWADYSLLTTAIQTAVQNKSYFIGAFHYYNGNAELAMTTIKNALQGYTKGTDYDFVTPSQLFDALMPTTVPTGGSSTDSDTTYGISMSGNVITLTGSDGQTTSVTLPVYNGGVT